MIPLLSTKVHIPEQTQPFQPGDWPPSAAASEQKDVRAGISLLPSPQPKGASGSSAPSTHLGHHLRPSLSAVTPTCPSAHALHIGSVCAWCLSGLRVCPLGAHGSVPVLPCPSVCDLVSYSCLSIFVPSCLPVTECPVLVNSVSVCPSHAHPPLRGHHLPAPGEQKILLLLKFGKEAKEEDGTWPVARW